MSSISSSVILSLLINSGSSTILHSTISAHGFSLFTCLTEAIATASTSVIGCICLVIRIIGSTKPNFRKKFEISSHGFVLASTCNALMSMKRIGGGSGRTGRGSGGTYCGLGFVGVDSLFLMVIIMV